MEYWRLAANRWRQNRLRPASRQIPASLWPRCRLRRILATKTPRKVSPERDRERIEFFLQGEQLFSARAKRGRDLIVLFTDFSCFFLRRRKSVQLATQLCLLRVKARLHAS